MSNLRQPNNNNDNDNDNNNINNNNDNKQIDKIQKVVTTTAQNTKISLNYPARKSPEKCTVSADRSSNRPKNLQRRRTKTKQKQKTTGKPGETSPFCAMNK